MIKELAARVQRIKPSPTLAVSARADELMTAGKNIISLSVGEPDFDTPDFIKEAAIKAIRNGMTKYTAVDGTAGLKKAIINKFERDNQLKYEPAQILVSCGAKHSLYNLFAALLNEGDEVIIPAPFWVSYPDMVKLMDAVPVIIKADLQQNFKITPAQLETAMTPQTRLVIFNSPSNPTGVAYTADELKALGKVLLKYPHVMVVTDDIYEHTLWNPASFVNILMVCPELYERCVVVNGVSKAYAMTGWRIGYAAGPAKLIAAMKKIQSQSTSNPASISQAAAQAALDGDQSCITTMTRAYKERHDYIVAELQKMPGVKVQAGDGTFYSFPSIEGVIEKSSGINNDIDVAEYLLNEAGIALVPGSAFGAPGYLRISYATSMEKIKDAMQRMRTAIENLLK
ncbi:MAG TPA: pyridoxal phosphate-dependent aminotransferase [Gammaproteobacteria bacterium]|nr:pyridoxal phosphate-dependent aminotransferase [Gammaproteobacteria bacterium]